MIYHLFLVACILLNAAASWSLGCSLYRSWRRRKAKPARRQKRVFDVTGFWDF